MSKSQRTKGAAGERELCAELAKLFPGETPKRTLGQARDGGYDIPLGRLRIECKRRKSLKTVYDWMKQCIAAVSGTTPGKEFATPVVMLRADNEEWLVLFRLKDISAVVNAVADLRIVGASNLSLPEVEALI